MSLNQWIAVAVAEKVGVVETAADFSKKRAGDARVAWTLLSEAFDFAFFFHSVKFVTHEHRGCGYSLKTKAEGTGLMKFLRAAPKVAPELEDKLR